MPLRLRVAIVLLMKITYLLMFLFGIDNPRNFTNLMSEQVAAEYVTQLYSEGILELN